MKRGIIRRPTRQQRKDLAQAAAERKGVKVRDIKRNAAAAKDELIKGSGHEDPFEDEASRVAAE